jgi:hypothetical protein
MRVTIDVSNTAPAGGTPPYIFGPFNSSLQPGEYVGLVSLYLPSGTELVRASAAGATTPTTTSEDGRTVITFRENLAAGERRTVTLDVRLPPRPSGNYRLVLVAPPRVRPTTASVDLQLDRRRVSRNVFLVKPVVFGE